MISCFGVQKTNERENMRSLLLAHKHSFQNLQSSFKMCIFMFSFFTDGLQNTFFFFLTQSDRDVSSKASWEANQEYLIKIVSLLGNSKWYWMMDTANRRQQMHSYCISSWVLCKKIVSVLPKTLFRAHSVKLDSCNVKLAKSLQT